MRDECLKGDILDALAGEGAVRAKRMFGGWGLYLDERFFGLIAYGTVFFKVDDDTRPLYMEKGSEPFAPVMKDRTMVTKKYYSVPDDVLEQPRELSAWARRAAMVEEPKKKKHPVSK